MPDGSHIHSQMHHKNCISRVPGISTKKMGIGVSVARPPRSHGLGGGAVAGVCERASHYRGEPVQLITRDRERHLRCIPGKENEFRIACPRCDVLMANYLASIQIRRLNIHGNIHTASFVA